MYFTTEIYTMFWHLCHVLTIVDGAIHGLGGQWPPQLKKKKEYNYITIYLGTNFSNFVQ